MPVEIRYMRSDQHTVNTLTAYKLGVEQTTTSLLKSISEAGDYPCRWWVYVYKRAADGTTTLIKSGYVERSTDGSGLQLLSLSIPLTSLASTDAIQVRVRIAIYSVDTNIYFITEQLGASQLDAVTWSVYLYTERKYNLRLDETDAIFYWGTTTYNSRIENFSWTPAPPPPVVVKHVTTEALTWVI
jgi:gamma-glutamylcyclotransferase (GGCT)/AIG2-like uncharacterized protein YtfP